MTQPVSFELAKLLEEKGFDENVKTAFNRENRNYTIFLNKDITIKAPTTAEVIMWLYEKHNIWVSASKYTKNGIQHWFTHYTTNAESQRAVQIHYGNPVNTVLEALEKGITYVLENLI